jgi:NAD(P)-dependent dehydrogenase (short-subunit alcohol dehydrogenase family)
VGSGAGVRPKDGLGAYGVAKAGLHSLTRSAALEWGRYGITVNGILPLVMTEQLHSVLEKNPGFALEVPPIGRVGDPQHDIGAAALFLASEAASYLSGQNIFVDGANSLR